MRLNVYVRSDNALVVLPDLFKPPSELASEGALQVAGWVDADAVPLSDSLVEQMTRIGYGVARGDEAVIFRSALFDGDAVARVV